MRLAAALMIVAGPVAAVSPGECARTPDRAALPLPGEEILYDRREVPVDLGGGWVVQQYEFAGGAGTQFGAGVTECRSGRSIIVVEAVQRPGASVEHLTTLSAQDAFRRAIDSADTIPLNEVLRQLTAAGASVGEDVRQPPDLESCGCAAFYPEMRGSKTRWTDWSRQ